MIVQLADVDFAYPGTEIFAGASWQVNPGDRVGLVGPNGAGKSTLLRLLAGRLPPDRGQVARPRGVRIAYLQQSQEFRGAGTLWDTLLTPFADVLALREEIAALERRLGEHSLDEKSLARYGELQERYRVRGGYTLEAEVRRLAADLGFAEDDFGRNVSTLSGGERGRLELAKILLEDADLLLLDEPTNHLDVAAVEHLEARLREWPRAFVVVSHDRYFLRAVCREIVDIEDGKLVCYPGGYERYVVDRRERLERLHAAFERQQETIAKTEDFIRRNLAGQKTKQAKSRRKMLEKIDRLDRPADTWEAAGDFHLRFSIGEHRGGREMLRARDLEVGFDGAPAVLGDVTLTVYRGDRVGIVGPNGSGKTTLLRALLGQVPARRGAVESGYEVQVGYFDQKLSSLNPEHTLIEEIRTIRGNWNEDVVRGYLGRFRFSGDEPFRSVKGLSGGESSRLALAKLMLEPRNLLVLDEPTNHLDIPAREVLEEALVSYPGTLVVVSHDRYFLDRVATRVFHVENGRVEQFIGNYSDFREQQARLESLRADQAEAAANASSRETPAAASPVAEEKVNRMAQREVKRQTDRERQRKERRLGEVEKRVAELEQALGETRLRLGENHDNDWQRLHRLAEEEQQLAGDLERLLSEWEKLSADLA